MTRMKKVDKALRVVVSGKVGRCIRKKRCEWDALLLLHQNSMTFGFMISAPTTICNNKQKGRVSSTVMRITGMAMAPG